MNIDRLRYFLAVAHEQNITAAANTLFISQAHLSREIIALEEDLGKQLFVRGKRKTNLTPEGIIFRSYASEVLRLLDQAKMEIAMTEEALKGDINMGCPESVALRFLASNCASFKEINPNVLFSYKTGSPDFLLNLLEEGVLDFIMLVGLPDVTNFEHYTLPVYDCWGLLMPKNHPLTNKETIHAKDLLNVPLLVPDQLLKHNVLSSWAGEYMDSYDIVTKYDMIFTASLMVEEGMGVAISLSPLVDVPQNEPLIFRPLDPPIINSLEIVWKSHRPLSKQADYFIRHIKKTIEDKTFTSTQFFID